MLGKKFMYKGIDFTDWAEGDIVLIDSVRNIPLRTQTFDRANFHGTYSSPTLAGWRLFIFRWQVYWVDKDARYAGWKKLIDAIQPEHNPAATNRWFYDLTWETDWGVEMTTKAKVFQAPEATNGLSDPIIEFSFTLYSESEKVYAPTLKTANGWIGVFIGTPLPVTLPTPLSGFAGTITCTNDGNRPAPVQISVVWSSDNPKLINVTNSNKYFIWDVAGWNPYTTTNLIYDNRNLTNDPTKLLVVTDQWQNIKAERFQGGDIFLEPWDNQIVVLSDNYPNPADVTITWRDTYFLT